MLQQNQAPCKDGGQNRSKPAQLPFGSGPRPGSEPDPRLDIAAMLAGWSKLGQNLGPVMLSSNTPTRDTRSLLRLVTVVLVLASCFGCGNAEDAAPPGAPVQVMTRNLYLGADLTPLALVLDPTDIPEVAADLWDRVQQRDFPARAEVVADEIMQVEPDLVALQEVALYRTQVPGDVLSGNLSPNATDVALDFLDLLMNAIEQRGGGYRVAGAAENSDAELPVADGQGGSFDLRLTDRDVILARDTAETSSFEVVPFSATFDLSVGGVDGLPISFLRSTSHVDAVVGDARLVFGNSHLEVELVSSVQYQQASELVDAYKDVSEPLLLLGDFNSAPETESYRLIADSFDDTYPAVSDGAPGYTCCQSDDLANTESTADERIDLVLSRGSWRVRSVDIIGSDPELGRTDSGLWASDHFGVAATLELSP